MHPTPSKSQNLHAMNMRLNLTYSCDKFRQPENALSGIDCSLLEVKSLQEKDKSMTNQFS